MGQQITDKKLKNKKFRRTEKAILEAFFSSKVILSVRVIAKRARISRSTFHRHHRTVYGIVPDYEEYILNKYCRLMEGLIKRKNIKLKTVYYQMLIFVLKNRDIFKLIVNKSDGRLIEKMVQKIEIKIMDTCKLPKNCDKTLKIYEKEIVGIIEDWIENDCTENELVVLNNIMYLTNTMRNRLIPLTN